MICTQCGAEMDQTDKNTFTGRVIREYACPKCGHTDWQDEGVALWQALHDGNEGARTKRQEAAAPGAHPSDSGAARMPEDSPSMWQRMIGAFRKRS